jgi:hypothetical protein
VTRDQQLRLLYRALWLLAVNMGTLAVLVRVFHA